MLPPLARQRTFTLTVDATPGDFSARAIVRQATDDAKDVADRIGRARVVVVSAPAGAILVVDQLKPGGDPATSGDWRTDLDENTATVGLLDAQDFCYAQGVGYRGKSGGSAGDIVIDVAWEALP